MDFFELLDYYIVGRVTRDDMIKVCEEMRHINLKQSV